MEPRIRHYRSVFFRWVRLRKGCGQCARHIQSFLWVRSAWNKLNRIQQQNVQAKHRQILSDNREKEKQRKARTHRLCEHGAILEAYFPQTIEMDNAQFSAFLQELAGSR